MPRPELQQRVWTFVNRFEAFLADNLPCFQLFFDGRFSPELFFLQNPT